MVDYVAAGNPDDRVIARAERVLASGGLVAVPTDTSWSVVCSFNSKDGIRKLKQLSTGKGSGRDERRFTLICSGIASFSALCSLDNARFRLIKRLSPGPYVFILKTLLDTEKALDLRRSEIGVRIPDHPLPQAIIAAQGCPLYAVTAKRSMINPEHGADGGEYPGTETAKDGLEPIAWEDLFEGGWELEALSGIDLIIDSGEERPRLLSTVIDLTGDEVRLLRQGAGAWPV
jgi:tRNA threonylcarbamoyl adenosine modification protein (Sua5/YciO/YrdC/YwlC family)